MTEPTFERILEGWLQVGPTQLPQRSLEAAIEATREARQGRPVGETGRPGRLDDPRRVRVLALVAAAAAFVIAGTVVMTGVQRADPMVTPAPASVAPSPSAAPETPAGVSHTSSLYGYSLRIPEGWEATPASAAWTAGTPVTGLVADVFEPPSTAGRPLSFTVVAVPVAAGTEVSAWTRGAVLPRRSGDPPTCSVSDTIAREPYTERWPIHPLGGRAWRVREACGYVDGAVVADGRAYLLSARGPLVQDGATDETRALFDRVAATFVPSPIGGGLTFADTFSVLFESSRYGYSVRLPADWLATTATEDWTGEGGLPTGEVLDVARAPGEPLLAVASVGMPSGTDLDGWIARADLARPEMEQTARHRHCVYRTGSGTMTVEAGWTDWVPARIAGREGRSRIGCGYIDGIVQVGERLYLISSFSSRLAPNDLGVFEALTDTMVFDGAPGPSLPTMSEPFDSINHGYSVRYPAGWSALVGLPWTDPNHPWLSFVDRFGSDLAFDDRVFWAASMAVGPGQNEEAWLAEVMPARRTGEFGECGPIPPDAAPEPWEPRTIAGLPARWRAACGHVDGVVFAGGRAYAFVVRDDRSTEDTPQATRDLFEAWISTVELRPEDATVSSPP